MHMLKGVLTGCLVLMSVAGLSAKSVHDVDSKSGWQELDFNTEVGAIVSITGGWTVDGNNYIPVGPAGYFGEDAARLEPYAGYKYDKRYPFGALLVEIPGLGVRAVAGPFMFGKSVRSVRIRINDTAFSDNSGKLRVAFE